MSRLINRSTSAIIVTSIFDNGWVERVSRSIIASGEEATTRIIFISDQKTPRIIYDKIDAARKLGVNILAPSIEEQRAFEKKLGIPGFFLENSDHRRNIGYLLAWSEDVNFVISMDDDNFPLNNNFVDEHRRRLGEQQQRLHVSCSSRAFNNCAALSKEVLIYPRGFPLDRRSFAVHNSDSSAHSIRDCVVGANGGLWLDSPDVDAISWLVRPVSIAEPRELVDVVLDAGTYCPLNSQNTAVQRRFLPAYYFIRMGYDIGGGLKFDRLGDIYSGYFLQKVIESFGCRISFGGPLVTHERNSHHFLRDANNEWGCLRTIDQFFNWFSQLTLCEGSVFDRYEHLADSLDEFAATEAFLFTPSLTAGFYHSMAYDMRKWLSVIRRL